MKVSAHIDSSWIIVNFSIPPLRRTQETKEGSIRDKSSRNRCVFPVLSFFAYQRYQLFVVKEEHKEERPRQKSIHDFFAGTLTKTFTKVKREAKVEVKVEESEASQGPSILEHFAKSIRVKPIKEECDENEEEEDVEEKKKDMMFERVNMKKKAKEAVGKVEVTEEAEMIVDENGSEEDSVEEEGPSVTQEKVKTEEEQELEEDESPETPLALSGIPRSNANEDDDEAMNSSFLDDSETPNWSAELLSDQPLSASGPSTGEWVGLGVTLPSQEIILTQQDIEDQEMKMASLKITAFPCCKLDISPTGLLIRFSSMEETRFAQGGVKPQVM